MGVFKDLTGQKFGRLTVIKNTGEKRHHSIVWECLCECGNKTKVASNCLQRGKNPTRSCGCLVKEKAKITGTNNVKSGVLREAVNSDRFKGTKICLLKNKKLNINNKSGTKGVSWNKRKSKWRATIKLNYEQIELGHYYELNDAIKARKQAEEKYFKPIIEEFKTLKERVNHGSEIKQKSICKHDV